MVTPEVVGHIHPVCTVVSGHRRGHALRSTARHQPDVLALGVEAGVSGSGKSSLVFDTIAAESQRLINETYSAFVQGFMPTVARPEVDILEGLTTAIIVDQERMGADARSTVGTATDANAMLRILFSRLGQPHIGSPNAFSFNVPSVRAVGQISISRRAP
jgi:excinuclease UvrABC ATPase subunit